MKKLLLAGLAGATAVATATPAQAHPSWHYIGGCGFFTLSDGTDSPQTKWDGEIHVTAVATDAARTPDPTASITIDCELRINGATPGTIVFSCTTPGTGFVACANGQFSFNADPDDIVRMCDIVTVNGEVHKDCGQSTTETGMDPIGDAIDDAERMVDSAICGMIPREAHQPPVTEIRDGDLYVLGEWVLDCPPYGPWGG